MARRSPKRLIHGGCIFAERPSLAAPDATIIWRADLDPTALSVSAMPASGGAPSDAFDADRLAPWLTIAMDGKGLEHAVLSDGFHHIRLDVVAGSLRADGPVVLHYTLAGLATAEPKLLPLRQLIHLCRYRRFAQRWSVRDATMPRMVTLLRVQDALIAGASQRDIAHAFYGERVGTAWRDTADSLRSRIRRLVREARALAAGGYRTLMR